VFEQEVQPWRRPSALVGVMRARTRILPSPVIRSVRESRRARGIAHGASRGATAIRVFQLEVAPAGTNAIAVGA